MVEFHTNTERTSWLEELEPSQKLRAILWSTFAKRRFYIFEHYWNIGKASRFAYKDAKNLSYKEVRKMYTILRIKTLQK